MNKEPKIGKKAGAPVAACVVQKTAKHRKTSPNGIRKPSAGMKSTLSSGRPLHSKRSPGRNSESTAISEL